MPQIMSIKYIVIHHSITPRDQDLIKSVVSFSASHKERLEQPATSLDLPEDDKYVAYHYVISGDGSKLQTRGIPDNFEIGYHAGNWEYNQESIGICLTGDFDTETVSAKQIETASDLITWIRSTEWGKDAKVIGHHDVPGVTKTCPGKNAYTWVSYLDRTAIPFNKAINYTIQGASSDCFSYAVAKILGKDINYIINEVRSELNDYSGGVVAEDGLGALKSLGIIKDWVKLNSTEEAIESYNRPLLMTMWTTNEPPKAGGTLYNGDYYCTPTGQRNGGHAVVANGIVKHDNVDCIETNDSLSNTPKYMPLEQMVSRAVSIYRLDV